MNTILLLGPALPVLVTVWNLWRTRDRKITMITGPCTEVLRCHGWTHNGRVFPRAEGQFFSHPLDEEGITWCWGWKQEDVDALVVAYSLR